jgi:KipI family sensor histidine kinase inhibitor
VQIPIWYQEKSKDFNFVCESKGLVAKKVIELHSCQTYQTLGIGFLPGFAYLGLTNKRLEVPRKEKPVQTRAGSVGLAGRQTGIYPVKSPGGWHIIGLCPLSVFDPTKSPKKWLIQPDSLLRFVPIEKSVYYRLLDNPKG